MNEYNYTEPKRKIFDLKFFTGITLLLLFLFLQTAFILYLGKGTGTDRKANDMIMKEVANKLNSVGLQKIAAESYAEYLKGADIDNSARAGIAFSTGKLYLEAREYEEALKWFYLVEIIDPATKLKDETGVKIVHCLEQLKKFNAAQYTLEDRTLKEKKGEGLKGAKIAAEIGKDEISVREVEDAINELPEIYRKNFTSAEQKSEFLKKYVADELLFRKALKLEFDKKAEIREKISKVTKNIIVQAIMDEEVMNKVKISEKDLELYFNANKQKYEEKGKEAVFKDVIGKVKQDYSMEKMQEIYTELIKETLTVSDVKLHPEVFKETK